MLTLLASRVGERDCSALGTHLCRPSVAWLTASLLLAAPAWATIGPPVRIRLPRDKIGAPAAAGQVYAGAVEVLVGADGVLANLRVAGEGWELKHIEFAGPRAVRAGETVRIPFQAVPASPARQLRFSFDFDGREISQTFDFSPARMARAGRPGAIRFVGATPPARAPAGATSGEGTEADTNFHMTGRITYVRDGGPTLGADSLRFEIWDDDSPFGAELMYVGVTGADGNFDIHFDWDDCDITGCDDPDIYIVFSTDNLAARVMRLDSEEVYTYSTEDDPWDDFTGNELHWGEMQAANTNDFPAFHISNSIVRAGRYVKAYDGVDIPKIDVFWPDGATGAFYSPVDPPEIHIGTDRQWNEITHSHELGHHYMYTFSVNTPPNYCNMVCDTTPTNCGHCIWCQENQTDAWNEGWPNWLGWAVANSYPPGYNETPWAAANDGRYNLENTAGCGATAQDPLQTEGFVAALLADMVDSSNGDDDGDGVADCDEDVMTISPTEIFDVVRLDKPTTVPAFISAFRYRHDQYEQDLWSTCGNVAPAYQFPVSPPVVESIGQSCKTYRAGQSISLQVQANGAKLVYQWRRNNVNLTNGARISGADTPTLVINSAQAADTGLYNCLVSTCNLTLSVPSTLVRVHVLPAPSTGLAALGFGRNHAGQTGRGTVCSNTSSCAANAEPVINLANFAHISAGEWHSVGVLADGSVWGWGENSYGEAVGHSSQSVYVVIPELVPEVTNAVMVGAGEIHTVVLRADGKVFAWGYNGYGSLGVPNASQYQPVEVPGLECMIAADAGYYQSLALGSDGTVWAWGYNAEGQLGRGFTSFYDSTPAPVPGLSNVIAIAAGGQHNLALKSDGTVWAWGWNSQGQLGDGTQERRTLPFQVPGLSGVTRISASFDHSMAVLSDGSARVWGGGGGKLGNGTVDRSFVPITPIGMDANVIAIAGGYYHTFFVKSDRTLWGCGFNYNGQLGQTNQSFHLTPFQLAGLSDIRGVAGRGQTSFVLTPGAAPAFSFVLGNQSAKVGGSLSWTAMVTGTPTLTFQWKHGDTVLVNGDAISGAHTATLTINPVSLAHAGTYTCTVTNAYGSASQSDTLTVNCIDPDLNCDEHVDAEDVAAIAHCATGAAVPGPPPGCTPEQFAAADLDNDGDVDADDFGRFQRCITAPGQLPPPNCAD